MAEKYFVERWHCALGHNHETEASAAKCEDIAGQIASKRLALKRGEERMRRAFMLHQEGQSWAQIGKLLGTTKSNAQALARRWREKAAFLAEFPEQAGLPARAQTALRALGIKTRAEALSRPATDFYRLVNCGRGTVLEILHWRQEKPHRPE